MQHRLFYKIRRYKLVLPMGQRTGTKLSAGVSTSNVDVFFYYYHIRNFQVLNIWLKCFEAESGPYVRAYSK